MLKCITTLSVRGVYYLDSWAFGIFKSIDETMFGPHFSFFTFQVIFPLSLQRKSLNSTTLCSQNLKLTIINEAEETFQSNIEDKTGTFSTIQVFIYLKLYFLSFSFCILSGILLFFVNNEALNKILGIITGTQTVRPVFSCSQPFKNIELLDEAPCLFFKHVIGILTMTLQTVF